MTTPIDTVQRFKILIIGDANVGKTSLMNRLVHGVFSNNYTATIGVDFKIATVNIGEYKCRLQIWFVFFSSSISIWMISFSGIPQDKNDFVQ